MKACEIASVFETIAPISTGIASDIENGFLGFRFGDRNVEVTGVGVAWFLSQEVVDAAVRKKLNMLIIHEPELFRQYVSPFHSNMQAATIPFNLDKMKKLLEHDICVYTAHSNWDLQTQVGMAPTVAKALGFSDLIKWDIGIGVFRIGKTTLSGLIKHVKKCMKLAHVRFQGRDDLPIKTVVLAYGSMGSEVEAILANNADAGIFGELREWPFIFAREAGVGIIETTHVRSESIGFASVVTELHSRLPDVRIEFLEVPYPFRLA